MKPRNLVAERTKTPQRKDLVWPPAANWARIMEQETERQRQDEEFEKTEEVAHG